MRSQEIDMRESITGWITRSYLHTYHQEVSLKWSIKNEAGQPWCSTFGCWELMEILVAQDGHHNKVPASSYTVMLVGDCESHWIQTSSEHLCDITEELDTDAQHLISNTSQLQTPNIKQTNNNCSELLLLPPHTHTQTDNNVALERCEQMNGCLAAHQLRQQELTVKNLEV